MLTRTPQHFRAYDGQPLTISRQDRVGTRVIHRSDTLSHTSRMTPDTTLIDSTYAKVFQPLLLRELKERGVACSATAGQQLIQPGQPIKVEPLMLSGALKVSRVNEDGQ